MTKCNCLDEYYSDMAAPLDQLNYELSVRESRSENSLMSDDIINDCSIAMLDNINACWNGWEAAVKFQDEDAAAYYMKIIMVLNDAGQKLRRIKK